MPRAIAVAVLLAAGAGALAGEGRDYPQLLQRFDYDPDVPLAVRDGEVRVEEGARVAELAFAVPAGGEVAATLVTPAGEGPFAGIVWLHGEGTDRSRFLPEALALAGTGAASLLLDAPPEAWATPQRGAGEAAGPGDELLVTAVRRAMRGFDLLASRRDVDARRLAFVGLGFGADAGAVLAGVETRARAYALAGALAHASRALGGADRAGATRRTGALAPGERARRVEALAPFDAAAWIGRAAPAALLLQFGRADRFVSEADAEELARAASSPRRVEWYAGGADFSDLAAVRDRLAFLAAQLALAPPGPRLAARVDDLARGAVLAPPPGVRHRVERNVVYKTGGGAPLALDLYAPDSRGESERFPVVLLCPDDGERPEAVRERPVLRDHARALVARGLAAVVFDRRSGEGMTRAVTAAGDVEDAVDFVRRRGEDFRVDPDRVALWAFGDAAPFALRRALRDSPAWLKAVVVYAGLFRTAEAVFPRAIGARRAVPAAGREFSPLDLVGRVRRGFPILVVAPALDAGSRLDDAEAFAAAAAAAKVPVELWEHETGRPGFEFRDDSPRSRELLARSYDWLRTALAPEASRPRRQARPRREQAGRRRRRSGARRRA